MFKLFKQSTRYLSAFYYIKPCNNLKLSNYEITANCRHNSTSITDKGSPGFRANSKPDKGDDLVPNLLDDPDQFGVLSPSDFASSESNDSNHSKPDDRSSQNRSTKTEDESESFRPIKRLSTKNYADIIKNHVNHGQIKEAIDMLDVLKEDRVKPESYIYSLLLGACGRVGYTKRAFMLFNDMKKRGLEPHAGAYTALFNACANSPWPATDGLSRAKKLLEQLDEKNYQPNDTNYNAMIKAFGRAGDIQTAFRLVDRMMTERVAITAATFNFLLQACVENQDSGFRYALVTWRKMIELSITPDLYTFNTLLRVTRDCGIGEQQVAIEAIDAILVSYHKYLEKMNKKRGDVERIESGGNLVTSELTEQSVVEAENPLTVLSNERIDDVKDMVQSCRPNLLAKAPHLGDIVAIKDIVKPQDRLLLLGGMTGFLDEMKFYKVDADIKTFTQLLDVIPSTLSAETSLMNKMKQFGVRPDIDFFNMLIKKRSMRFDHENAKLVLNLIYDQGLRPDLITFGVLAIGCKSRSDARNLIEMMREHQCRINIEILGAMLYQACYRNNFKYIIELMQITVDEKIQPNKKFMQHLHNFNEKLRELAKKKDKFVESSHYKEWYPKFKAFEKDWLNRAELDTSEETHPWQQFREPNENGNKIKEKSARFKPRLASKFKVKTSTKVRY